MCMCTCIHWYLLPHYNLHYCDTHIHTYIHTYIYCYPQNGSVNAFYSTPTRYLDALHNAGLTWELKTDDFFPYADCPYCYWTGYFTSRVALKGYVRSLNGYLQVMCVYVYTYVRMHACVYSV